MEVYIYGTLLSVGFAYCYSKVKESKKILYTYKFLLGSLFVFLSVIPLTWIMAVRRGVGSDYWSYWLWFNGFSRGDLEPGYIFLSTILRKLFDSPQSIFIVCAIIICGGYFFVIYKESANPAYSILLFVLCKDYFIAMNGMRQYVAGVIVLFAIPYIKERNWIRSFIIIFIASCFHKSSLIFIAFYMLYAIPVTPVVAACIFTGGILFSGVLVQFILPFLSSLGLYVNYLSLTSSFHNTTGDINLAYILIFFAFFLLLSFEYKQSNENKNFKLIYTADILSLFLLSIGAIMPLNFHRITWFMNAFIAIYIPEITSLLKNKPFRKFINMAIIVSYAIYTIKTISEGNQDVIPYYTIWSY